jgi:hypothetical protein
MDHVDKDLDRVDRMANDVLDHEASILDSSVLNVSNFDKEIDKIQAIESDGFDRVQAALEDQVPFAAGEVVQQLVVATVAITFIVVLVGFAGVRLLRTYQPAAGVSSGKALWRALRPIPMQTLTVALPMLLLALVILGAYRGYRYSTQIARVNRLQNAAAILEKVSDFRAAATFRKRAFGIGGKPDSTLDYAYRRDLWLADFLQAHQGSPTQLNIRLSAIERAYGKDSSNNMEDEDGELKAAGIYLRGRYGAVVPQEEIDSYKERFLKGSTVPALGKLVYVTSIRHHLATQGLSPTQRMSSVEPDLHDLTTKYPSYAAGHVIRAMLLSAQADVLTNGVDPLPQQSTSLQDIQTRGHRETTDASSSDPDLVTLVQLNNIALPSVISAKVIASSADFSTALPADLIAPLNEYLISDLVPRAHQLYSSDNLAKLIMAPKLKAAVVLCKNMDILSKAVDAARAARVADSPPSVSFSKYVAAALAAVNAKQYLVADQWMSEAQKLLVHAQAPDKLTYEKGLKTNKRDSGN